MRIRRALPYGLSLAVLLVALFAGTIPAAEKTTTADRVWTTPDLASLGFTSVALLPPATFDGNVENRKLVETALGQALKSSGHRWSSPFLVRDNLLKAGGDSLIKALHDKLLKGQVPRVDSLDAPYLSRVLRTRTILTVRVDQMERRELEPGQSGRPSTSIQLRGALVDSTGRLLWACRRSETIEGAQQQAGENIIGMKASGLNNTAVGLTQAAPLYQEVLGKIGVRWGEAFPRRAAADSSRAPRDTTGTKP